MEISSLLSFIVVSMLLTLAPGPDIVYVITQSITAGKRAGIATALGLCTGLIFHTTAAAFGISQIFRQSELAFTVLKYAGAIYMFYLAWLAFREKFISLTGILPTIRKTFSLYRQGILMNILNPKVALFFLAFLPQFVNTRAGNVSEQMLLLGVLFIIQAIIIFTLISVFAGIFGNRLVNNPRVSKTINYAKGSIFILIGIKLALADI